MATDAKDPKIAGPMWCKSAEWPYGKAKEHVAFNASLARVISVEDARRIAREMLGSGAPDCKTLTIEAHHNETAPSSDHNGTDPTSASG